MKTLRMSELQSKILKLLEDGQFHSGESLGERLGVSRTAVWKQLQKLEAIGLQLESVKGTGYRVPAGFELLKASRLSASSGGLLARWILVLMASPPGAKLASIWH